MNKHIEAAAAAIKGIKVFRPTPEDMAQAAYNAIIESLASAGEDGVVEAMVRAFGCDPNRWHQMRRALAVARLSMGEVERDASRAAKDVLRERRRQISREGWSAEHDDEHAAAELALAGAAYALHAADHTHLLAQGEGDDNAPVLWPWDESWWKPKDARSDLVRAAALIIAEIERIDRAEDAARAAEGGGHE